jgi:hypothetical protein
VPEADAHPARSAPEDIGEADVRIRQGTSLNAPQGALLLCPGGGAIAAAIT